MSTFHHALDSKNELIFGNFPSGLIYLLSDKQERPAPIEINLEGKKQKARFGSKTNIHGTIYIVTTEIKFVSSFKMFKELLKMSVISLDSLTDLKRNICFNQNALIQELIHNLTSLNTYNIQDLFSLIPQQVLTQNINKQNETIRNIIVEKPIVTANTLLKLIKYNLAMKIEFSVFEKTIIPYPSVQKIEYSIKDIVLSILQIFIEDFEERKIEVSIDACEKRLIVDYDTLSVSLYFILENAIKYCSPNTKFKIFFKEEANSFSILFDMVSIRIENHEVKKLCEKNFRGASAILLTKEGKGIGMYRILKTLKLNNAEIEILPRISNFVRETKDAAYEHNQFKIKFIGQQDWFKRN